MQPKRRLKRIRNRKNMTQEQKDKLELAAEKWYGNTPGDRTKNVFKHGAQTVLDNPQEWLPPVQYWQLRDENKRLQSQLSRYREALEDVDIELSHEGYANSSGEGVDKARTVIKEALKQEEAK